MTRLAGVLARLFLVGALGGASASCAASHGAQGAVVPHGHAARVEDAFDGEPALLVVLRPAKLARDPLYGPLIRRASELASTRAAVAAAVGSTALAALERTDEVLLGVYDHDARDAVVALRGVPADVDAARIVDTEGKPLWTHLHELPGGVEELAPADPSADASLFVLPRRAWVIAVGLAAITRTRAAFTEGPHGADARLGAIDADPLAVARLRGDALVHARPSLSEGPLGPVVRDLEHVTVSLEPGPEGSVGEVTARFVYGDLPFAEKAEACVADVLAAFTRTFDKKAPWLHAVKVTRLERAVVVRGRIPRAWADGFLHVDLDEFAR